MTFNPIAFLIGYALGPFLFILLTELPRLLGCSRSLAVPHMPFAESLALTETMMADDIRNRGSR